MKLTVIEGGLPQWVELLRKPGDIVTIKHPIFSTVSISGRLVQFHPNETATIKNPCGEGCCVGEIYSSDDT